MVERHFFLPFTLSTMFVHLFHWMQWVRVFDSVLWLWFFFRPRHTSLSSVCLFSHGSRSFNFLEHWRADETDIDDLNWMYLSHSLTHMHTQKRKVSQNRIVFVCQRIRNGKRNIYAHIYVFLLKYAHKHILCCSFVRLFSLPFSFP